MRTQSNGRCQQYARSHAAYWTVHTITPSLQEMTLASSIHPASLFAQRTFAPFPSPPPHVFVFQRAPPSAAGHKRGEVSHQVRLHLHEVAAQAQKAASFQVESAVIIFCVSQSNFETRWCFHLPLKLGSSLHRPHHGIIDHDPVWSSPVRSRSGS